jgi:hypothetical protein
MSAAGHIDPSNKKVALLIALLALVLAVSETLGKSAQTAVLSYNIEASNLWAFFQAKTVRVTTVRTAAESAQLEAPAATGEARAAYDKQIEAWKKTAARYESEPETNEGRKELAARAKSAEERRDRALAAIITTVMALAWIGAGLGVVSLALMLVGLLAPTAVHLF